MANHTAVGESCFIFSCCGSQPFSFNLRVTHASGFIARFSGMKMCGNQDTISGVDRYKKAGACTAEN